MQSRSFGRAVADALAYGLPVLATTGTPWTDLGSLGCGWTVSRNVPALVRGLETATALSVEKLRSMGANGHDWMAAEFGWSGVARRYLAAYAGLASQVHDRVVNRRPHLIPERGPSQPLVEAA